MLFVGCDGSYNEDINEEANSELLAVKEKYEELLKNEEECKITINELKEALEKQNEAISISKEEYDELILLKEKYEELNRKLITYHDRGTGLYGFRNVSGEVIFEPIYDSASEFRNGESNIRMGSKYGTISELGEVHWDKSMDYEEVQLLPVDESVENIHFSEFIASFKAAIENHDLEFVLEHVDKEGIQSRWGGGAGIDDFLWHWNLKDNVDESLFWNEMRNAINLGCVSVNEEKTTYYAPYIFETFPDKFDAFEFYVCIGESVNVYDQPDKNSVVTRQLNYTIVKHTGRTEGQWLNVSLPDGERGFIHRDNLRSPIDYRVKFNLVGDLWIIDYFIAGD